MVHFDRKLDIRAKLNQIQILIDTGVALVRRSNRTRLFAFSN